MSTPEATSSSLPRNIVVLGVVYWSGSTTQRPQHLHQQLARYFSVYYLEKPRNLLSVFFPQRIRIWKRYSDFFRIVRRVTGGLFAITSVYFLPYKRTGWFFSRLTFLERLNQRIVCWYLKRILRRRGVGDYILWLEDMKWLPFIDWLNPALVVYDCMDNREAFPYAEAVRKRLGRLETEMDRRADLILVSSQFLRDKFKNPNIYALNNSTNFAHFAGVAYRCGRPGERPQVGYIGSIERWLDFDLLLWLVRALPEYDFVLVGRIDSSVEKERIAQLRGEPNVRFAGIVHYDELPSYLERFSVAITPYEVSDLTRAIDPCKTYEYLAGGKPIVSSPLPEMEKFSRWVTIARTLEEWVAGIRRGVEENDPTMAAERREVSRRNSWEARTSDLVRFLHSDQVIALISHRRSGNYATSRRHGVRKS